MDFQVNTHPLIEFFVLNISVGYNHVLTIFAYPRLGRPRNRDAPQRSVRAQFNMA
jgi:hypothetical protein